MQVINSQSEIDSFVKQVEDESRSKFICISVDRGFSDKDWQPLSTNRVYWQWSGGGGTPSIEFTGVPFMFVGGKRLGCYRGKDRAMAQKKKYAEEKAKRTMVESYSSLSHTSRSQYTKKVGCPATISISRIAMFPKFKLSDNRERTRKRTSKALRLALQKDPVVWETCYVVTHHSEHSGHDTDETLNGKMKRRKRQKDLEGSDCESPSQKRARKSYLKKKCIQLSKQLLEKLYFIDDRDKLEELSGKLGLLLDELAPFSCSENQRPPQTDVRRPRVCRLFTSSTLTQHTIQRLKVKYTDRTKPCRKSVTSVSPAWPVHAVPTL